MPDPMLSLEATLRDRLATAPVDSYSAKLFADPELLQRKIMEEAFEVCLELHRRPVEADRTVAESADLVFHLLAGLVSVGESWDSVLAELERRAS